MYSFQHIRLYIIRLVGFSAVSFKWKNYLSFRVSDWQQGIIELLQWAILSSQMTDSPCGNISVLLKLSLQLYIACGLGTLARADTHENTNRSLFQLQLLPQVREPPTFFFTVSDQCSIPESHRPLKMSRGVKGGRIVTFR